MEFKDGKKLTVFLGEQSPYPHCLFVGAYTHPRYHGEIADGHLAEGKPIHVNTLSEAYVCRIRRRMAEGVITPEDVTVYGQHPDGTWEEIEINKYGAWHPSSEADLVSCVLSDMDAMVRAAVRARREERASATQ